VGHCHQQDRAFTDAPLRALNLHVKKMPKTPDL